ncbi:hypothetical protein [Embleya sp. AB8]
MTSAAAQFPAQATPEPHAPASRGERRTGRSDETAFDDTAFDHTAADRSA